MIKETDIAAAVIKWLSSYPDWEVFQEVRLYYGEARPDIVVKMPYKSTSLYWIIEVKGSMSLQLLGQCIKHRQYGIANYVSAAFPMPRRILGRRDYTPDAICAQFGIGILHINSNPSQYDMLVNEIKKPKMMRRDKASMYWDIERYLTEHHKSGLAAGSAGGGYVTPFRVTCGEIARYLKENPGASVKDIVNNVDHHWRTPSTAKTCILHWARLGKLHGVRTELDGRRVKFYAESA